MTDNSKRTLLICDDEEGIRESLKLVLSEEYDLKFAHDGTEALKMLKTLTPSVMLLDIKMPKIHGMEILRQVKKMKPKLPVVIVTGYQSVEMAQEALKNGASDYIPKPFESDKLLKAVEKLVK